MTIGPVLGLSILVAAPTALAAKVGDPLAFYSTAATVIPVLFLALIYQANVIGDERSSTLARLGYAYGFFVFGVIGEIDAMIVLSTREPSSSAHWAVVLGLIYLGFALASEPLTDAAAAVVHRYKLPIGRAAIFTGAVSVGVVLQVGFSTRLL